jgi:hypothetical protein
MPASASHPSPFSKGGIALNNAEGLKSAVAGLGMFRARAVIFHHFISVQQNWSTVLSLLLSKWRASQKR